jgi:hypothetical protein
MDPPLDGRYISLVVRVEELDSGDWAIAVDGGGAKTLTLPLQPATFVLRLWHIENGQVLRGTLGLQGDDNLVPLHINWRIEQLVRRWLMGGAAERE